MKLGPTKFVRPTTMGLSLNKGGSNKGVGGLRPLASTRQKPRSNPQEGSLGWLEKETHSSDRERGFLDGPRF